MCRQTLSGWLADENLKVKVKHSAYIMVWGCFSVHGPGALVTVSGRMNAADYVNILRENLRKSAEDMGTGDNFIFQQDNSPVHTAATSRKFFQQEEIELSEWVSNSPDYNPIENLWDEVDRRIPKESRRRMRDFEAALIKTWKEIPVSVCEGLVRTMSERLTESITRNGGHTHF